MLIWSNYCGPLTGQFVLFEQSALLPRFLSNKLPNGKKQSLKSGVSLQDTEVV